MYCYCSPNGPCSFRPFGIQFENYICCCYMFRITSYIKKHIIHSCCSFLCAFRYWTCPVVLAIFTLSLYMNICFVSLELSFWPFNSFLLIKEPFCVVMLNCFQSHNSLLPPLMLRWYVITIYNHALLRLCRCPLPLYKSVYWPAHNEGLISNFHLLKLDHNRVYEMIGGMTWHGVFRH
jgi:hypothetical protein